MITRDEAAARGLNPARGILIGLLLSGLLWAVIILVLVLV